MIGKKTWVFPDAERPAQTEEGSLDAHESLLVLNPNSDEVLLNIRFFRACLLYASTADWTRLNPIWPSFLVLDIRNESASFQR